MAERVSHRDPAVEPVGGDAEEQSVIGDHRGSVVLPVRVFALDESVHVDEFIDGRIADPGGDRRRRGDALGNDVRPAVGGARVKAHPRIAVDVAELGPVSLVWPRCDGLLWPHLRHAGVPVMAV